DVKRLLDGGAAKDQLTHDDDMGLIAQLGGGFDTGPLTKGHAWTGKAKEGDVIVTRGRKMKTTKLDNLLRRFQHTEALRMAIDMDHATLSACLGEVEQRGEGAWRMALACLSQAELAGIVTCTARCLSRPLIAPPLLRASTEIVSLCNGGGAEAEAEGDDDQIDPWGKGSEPGHVLRGALAELRSKLVKEVETGRELTHIQGMVRGLVEGSV
ncbi:hypothetical protein KIPB_012766, partial [Kipferlia bialata]